MKCGPTLYHGPTNGMSAGRTEAGFTGAAVNREIFRIGALHTICIDEITQAGPAMTQRVKKHDANRFGKLGRSRATESIGA